MENIEENIRFHGMMRLFGKSGLAIIQKSHVCVIGIGGVGSWAVEALARSGIGRLTLVDLDETCLSNVNRQIHSLTETIGRPKTEVMGERVHSIHPQCQVHLINDFVTEETIASILQGPFDYILDAIDGLKNKCLIASLCKVKGIPLLTSGAAGGITNPLDIRISDLNHCHHDKLLMRMRKKLRRDFGFPKATKIQWGIDAIFSVSPRVYPSLDGSVCDLKGPDNDLKLDCESGLGTASFVTGSYGFFAASHIIKKLTE